MRSSDDRAPGGPVTRSCEDKESSFPCLGVRTANPRTSSAPKAPDRQSADRHDSPNVSEPNRDRECSRVRTGSGSQGRRVASRRERDGVSSAGKLREGSSRAAHTPMRRVDDQGLRDVSMTNSRVTGVSGPPSSGVRAGRPEAGANPSWTSLSSPPTRGGSSRGAAPRSRSSWGGDALALSVTMTVNLVRVAVHQGGTPRRRAALAATRRDLADSIDDVAPMAAALLRRRSRARCPRRPAEDQGVSAPVPRTLKSRRRGADDLGDRSPGSRARGPIVLGGQSGLHTRSGGPGAHWYERSTDAVPRGALPSRPVPISGSADRECACTV